MKQYQNKLILGLILGIVVFVGLGIYADFNEMSRLLQQFNWGWLPLILGLTSLNYLLRFAKWHYYLAQIGITNLPVKDHLRIFVGGFGLSLTPGKAGELIRTIWYKNRVGVHPTKTAPMSFAERITDGMAMTILALGGVIAYPQYWLLTITVGLVLVIIVIILQIRPLVHWFLNFGEKLPLVSNIIHHLHTMYESTYQLLRLKNLLVAVGLGCLAWSSQGLAFYLVLVGLGSPPSFSLLFLAVFILNISSVVGGYSGMPGGLGVTEGSMTGLLQLMVGLPQNQAATATLLIRFCTLWFGVTAGLLTILIWRRFLFEPVAVEEEIPQTVN